MSECRIRTNIQGGKLNDDWKPGQRAGIKQEVHVEFDSLIDSLSLTGGAGPDYQDIWSTSFCLLMMICWVHTPCYFPSRLMWLIQTVSCVIKCVVVLLCVAESRRPVKDCFLAVLSSHGEEGCVFGADGKPVRLSHIYRCFDNECMEKKAKVFLIQVGNKPNANAKSPS